MTDRILNFTRLADPRISDKDIADAVREFGSNKQIRGDGHTIHTEAVLSCIVDIAINKSAAREVQTNG